MSPPWRALRASVLALALAGCGFVYDEPVDGEWRLVGIDLMEDTILCRRIAGAACVGDQLPGPTVFAAGADARYVVLARHPRDVVGSRRETEYYYFRRPPAGVFLQKGDVLGPFDQAAFEAEKRRLGLPEFSRVVEELR